VRAARFQADILTNLAAPDLEVAAVALRHRITPRYVHKLFEDEAATFSPFVLQQRLAWVHRMLCDARLSCESISTSRSEVFAAGVSAACRGVLRLPVGASPNIITFTGTEPRGWRV
jgi:hypothetical protein